MKDTEFDPVDEAPVPRKKTYRPPVLHEWGSLKDLTQTAGKFAPHGDGGKGKRNKQTS